MEDKALIPYEHPEPPADLAIIDGQVTRIEETSTKRPPLAKLQEDWLASKRTDRTKDGYKAILQDFLAFLVEYREDGLQVHPFDSPWQSIEKAVRAFLPQRGITDKETGVKRFFRDPMRAVTVSTKNIRLAALRDFYQYVTDHNYLNDSNHLGRNPLRLLKADKNEERPRKAPPLAPEQVKAGIEAIDTSQLGGLRDKTLLSLLLSTGRRVSEVRNLKWEHVSLSSAGKLVAKFYCKGGKVGTNVLTPNTRGLVEQYRARLIEHGYSVAPEAPVFVNLSHHKADRAGEGLSIESISQICEKHLQQSKVHATRHTYALRAWRNGATVKELQEDLGHSNIAILTVYLESLEKEDQERTYAAALEKEFGI